MLHVKNRTPGFAPRGEHFGDFFFGAGIVASAPLWMVETFLNIDDDQRRVLGQSNHFKSPEQGRVLNASLLRVFCRVSLAGAEHCPKAHPWCGAVDPASESARRCVVRLASYTRVP
jgi:hypothetical protein